MYFEIDMPILLFIFIAVSTGNSLKWRPIINNRHQYATAICTATNAKNWMRTSSVAADVFLCLQRQKSCPITVDSCKQTYSWDRFKLGRGSRRSHANIHRTQDVCTSPTWRTTSWADGVAYPRHGLIFLRSQTLEMVDLIRLLRCWIMNRAHFTRPISLKPVPRWLQEGVAQLEAGEYRRDTVDRCHKGYLVNLSCRYPIWRGFPQRAG